MPYHPSGRSILIAFLPGVLCGLAIAGMLGWL